MFLQLAEQNVQLAANCGLPPIKPLRSRDKAPDKWREYDAKLKKYNDCRTGKGKPTAGSRNPLATTVLAPGRALFLGMVSFNLDGIATKLARQDWKRLQGLWLKAGGNPKKLSDAINKGKGKKVKKIALLSKFKGGQMSEDIFLSEEQMPEELKTKIITASTGAGTTIGSLIPAIGTTTGAAAGTSMGKVIVMLYPLIKKAADDKIGDIDGEIPPPTPEVPEGENIPEGTGSEGGANGGETFFQKNKFLIIGGAVAAVGLIYFLTRKK